MQVDDPPYLSVGTAVSAKYKGAFCEAKVSKVDRMVKCKVTYKSGLGSGAVTDNEIKGTLRVGQQVQVKHPDHKDLVEATITKIQDCSQYTVVFDDGDITTLRRTALCLKSGRHFNESETLDQLPLTHPEHFGIPVMGGRRGRRNRLLKDESSDEEIEEENEPDLEGYTQDIGRVVSVETGENKRGKEKWFPGLIVIPSAQPTVKINVKDEFLIRSFRDDRYYTVPKKEVNEYNRDLADKSDSSGLTEAIQKANKYLDSNELPLHWEKSSLFNISGDSDSDDNATDTSDEEQSEEKDRFVAQLYKFMDDSGTPLNKTPVILNKDIDLHRLFRVVHKMGGYNRVTNQNKWKSVTAKLKLSVNQNISNQVKSVYKKCLLSYEGFYRTLGVTMSNPTRATKKNKGRSLIRDKDRTPMSSPRPDDEGNEKIIDKKETIVPEKVEAKLKRKPEPKEKEETPKRPKVESRDASSDLSDVPSTSSSRPKRHENKQIKEKKPKPAQGEKVKVLVEKIEESVKKEEKVQFTRSKSVSSTSSTPTSSTKSKELPKEMVTTRQSKEATNTPPIKTTPKHIIKKVIHKEEEEKERKVRPKKKTESDKSSSDSGSTTDTALTTANLGDKLIVYYGPTNESKVTYEAKVVDMDKDQTGPIYLVHYTGWNTRYDEWIPASRIAENLSSGVKSSRRTKVPAPVNVRPASHGPSTSSTKPLAAKRNRVTSVSSRGPHEDKPPRSTTPSSITSSSSRTKSPATPATRSNRLAARQESSKRRRISAQTDISIQSESESDSSESEPELSRTRSGSIKEPDVKVYRKRVPRPAPPPKPQKRKEQIIKIEDDDTEREEEPEKPTRERRVKKVKKMAEKSADESDEEDSIGHPKGRDFDLNQIRSELKGFSKALKVPPVDIEKDGISSSDDSSLNTIVQIKQEKEEIKVEEEEEVPKESPKRQSPKLEKSSSSEDIYEFKEPEPFEFESRSKLVDDKNVKKRLPRIFEELEKSPRKRGAKSPLSPGKTDKLDLPEPRTYSRVPKKIQISDDEDDDLMEDEDLPSGDYEKEDPFDKLIVSPSFNFIRTTPEKPVENKPSTSLLDEPLSLFKELPETSDEFSGDMELSDCESQTQIFTRADTLFSNTFSKSPLERNTPDLEYSSGKTDEGKTTNSDDDDIQAQIQRAIAQSSTDDDSNDALINLISSAEGTLKKPDEPTQNSTLTILGVSTTSPAEALPHNVMKEAVVPLVPVTKEHDGIVTKEKEPDVPKPKPEQPPKETKPQSPKKPIDPALQETDSSLLELIVSKPPLILNPKLDDTGKELTVKTGTKIADSILQKFNFIKNNIEPKPAKPEPSTSSSGLGNITVNTDKLDTKPVTSPKLEVVPEQETSNVDNKLRSGLEAKTRPSVEPKVILEAKPRLSTETKPVFEKKETKPVFEKKSGPKPRLSTETRQSTETKLGLKPRLSTETKQSLEVKSVPKPRLSTETKQGLDNKTGPMLETKPIIEEKESSKVLEIKEKLSEIKAKVETPIPSTSKVEVPDIKRRRRVISKAYIDESESDSSDSENLVIARSDEDSHSSSSDNKPLIECKENTDSNMSLQKIFTTDDSQSQPEEEKRNFSFENIKPKDIAVEKTEVIKEPPAPVKELEIKTEVEPRKEDVKDEQDPNLHSLLLCEEEIPKSPAPAPELPNPPEASTSLSVHEIPFASAPGTSNSKMLLEPKKVPPPLVIPPPPPERESRADAQTVIENTPPTTPESTISNLSPRGDNGNISPNSNDSKSNEGEPDFEVDHRRTSSLKVSPYSEEDTQTGGDLSTSKKSMDTFGPPASCRKRRRSLRFSEDGSSSAPVPAKRGRKPRQRRDSDSDDASECSMAGSVGGGGNTPRSTSSLYDRPNRSPRPSKYNFFVEFDPSLDSAQRIAVLQQKLTELRKTYADVKAELAAVERRRKKIRRREREALKTAKQELACA